MDSTCFHICKDLNVIFLQSQGLMATLPSAVMGSPVPLKVLQQPADSAPMQILQDYQPDMHALAVHNLTGAWACKQRVVR